MVPWKQINEPGFCKFMGEHNSTFAEQLVKPQHELT